MPRERPSSWFILRECASCRCDLEPPADGVLLCADCRKALSQPRTACKRCGAAVGENLLESTSTKNGNADERPAESCRHCRNSDFAFDTAIALGDYDGEVPRPYCE